MSSCPQRRRLALALGIGLPLATASWFARAQQEYPTRVIRWIVSFAPGGSGDVLSRLLSPGLSKALGQPVVIENKTGAGGNIGGAFIAQSPPDGYTIGFAYSGTYSINPSVYANMPFKQSDFVPIIWLSTVPMIIVVPADLPVRTVRELIDLDKKSPGKLNFGSAGLGSINHLAGVVFNNMAGTTLTHVPYRGGAPATAALLSGEISLIFAEPASVVPHLKAGKLRALAVTSARPSRLMPELPTVADSGLPGFDVTSWNGMLAPAGTPPPIVARLNAEFNRLLSDPAIQEQMLGLGFEAVGGTPQQFGDQISAETVRWAKVVKQIGMKLE